MKTMLKNSTRGALTLLVFAVVFTALMAGTYALTRSIVQKNELDAKTALLAQVLPKGSYDNDLLAAAKTLAPVDCQRLNVEAGCQLYLAKKGGQAVAAVIETVAPDGYSGKIRLLVGVNRDGVVQGVRVIAHKETPGLGDYIDAAKSAWSEQFSGKSLSNPTENAWKVKKDGGAFDYTAGATISPRAVVKAVHNVLGFVNGQRANLFGA
ncbi:electron transport complex subunit RsxG [Chitinilyticum piscinae]|uniref:Ion-translocating oxidoreductase complex subunit G n=1 Tax=Chitinilyticum piscinae TaxID=2866724 RepID=A0A8J7FPW6_9NEIS|nr:electron transport complex subunit RsxG [Chitinilyticum piscinae]MBE9610049.1 electron transport complex subunit RsxG [Chitinilyticum piscinae]